MSSWKMENTWKLYIKYGISRQEIVGFFMFQNKFDNFYVLYKGENEDR
jgi:hypothetical protein